jgi:hypothetical protein
MRFLSSLLLTFAIGWGLVCAGAAQTVAPVPKPAPWKRYCQPDNGFCFKYPDSWTMLGEVFGGNGVVVAPQQKEERTLWDEITLAMIAPAPEDGKEPATLDGIVDQAAVGMRDAGENFVTLQRQQRRVDDKPAEMLKAEYHEKATGRDWLEEVVFIEGADGEIYSVALKCAPQNLARREPVLDSVLRSWTLPEPEPSPSEEAAQPQTATPATTAPTSTPH